MPWHVEARDGKFVVVVTETGEVVGTHDTRADADAQVAALNINVHKDVFDALRELFAPEPAPVVSKDGRITSPQSCHYCKMAATHGLVWAEGASYIPACDMHDLNARADIEKGGGEVADVVGIPSRADLAKEADTDGVMVALYVPANVAEQAAVDGGTAVADMHLTLCYIGSSDEVVLDAGQLATLIGPVAAAHGPVEVKVIGTARFAPKPDMADVLEPGDGVEEPLYPYVLLVSPTDDLLCLRNCIAEELCKMGVAIHDDYAFEPHITLDYVGLMDDDPVRVAQPIEFVVPAVSVSHGSDRIDIALTGTDADTDGGMFLATEKGAGWMTLDIDKAEGNADEKRYTLAPVYLPDTEDAHGEFVGADDLQQAFWGYLKDSREIHLQHTAGTVAGELVECVAWPAPFETMLTVPGEEPKPITFPAGTVYAGIVWTPEAWGLIKKGKLRGLSMGGRAKRLTAE